MLDSNLTKQHGVVVLRVAEALADLCPFPWFLVGSTSGIGHDASARHALFAFGQPPHFFRRTDHAQDDDARTDCETAQEEVLPSVG